MVGSAACTGRPPAPFDVNLRRGRHRDMDARRRASRPKGAHHLVPHRTGGPMTSPPTVAGRQGEELDHVSRETGASLHGAGSSGHAPAERSWRST